MTARDIFRSPFQGLVPHSAPYHHEQAQDYLATLRSKILELLHELAGDVVATDDHDSSHVPDLLCLV